MLIINSVKERLWISLQKCSEVITRLGYENGANYGGLGFKKGEKAD
jgi:hypothetical protein